MCGSHISLTGGTRERGQQSIPSTKTRSSWEDILILRVEIPTHHDLQRVLSENIYVICIKNLYSLQTTG